MVNMKKALIINDAVIQVEDTRFPVAAPLTWMDCPNDCKAGWKIHEGALVEYTPDEIAALAIEKAEEVTGSITLCRDTKLFGGISVNGIDVQTDDLSQQRLMAARIIAKEDPNYTVNWKSQNGFVTLTSPMIVFLADAVRAHVQKCFDVEKIITERHATNPYMTVQGMKQAFNTYFQNLSE
jgi:hypothetical protein